MLTGWFLEDDFYLLRDLFASFMTVYFSKHFPNAFPFFQQLRLPLYILQALRGRVSAVSGFAISVQKAHELL